MTLKEINEKLKGIGLGYVKMNTPTSWDIDSGKCHTGWDAKRTKGIRGGSIGPMTMTSAHVTHNEKVVDKLREEFPGNFSYEMGGIPVLTFDIGNKIKTYKFTLQTFPTNSRDMDLDEGYQTYWWVPTVSTTNKESK